MGRIGCSIVRGGGWPWISEQRRSGRGRSAAAAAIFAFLRAVRPGIEAGHVGGALCDLALGDVARAESHLRAAPQTEAVIAFLALVHSRAGDRRKADELLADLGFMRAGMAVMEIAQGAAPRAM